MHRILLVLTLIFAGILTAAAQDDPVFGQLSQFQWTIESLDGTVVMTGVEGDMKVTLAIEGYSEFIELTHAEAGNLGIRYSADQAEWSDLLDWLNKEYRLDHADTLEVALEKLKTEELSVSPAVAIIGPEGSAGDQNDNRGIIIPFSAMLPIWAKEVDLNVVNFEISFFDKDGELLRTMSSNVAVIGPEMLLNRNLSIYWVEVAPAYGLITFNINGFEDLEIPVFIIEDITVWEATIKN